MYSCALAHVNPSGWLGLHHNVGQVMDVCPPSMSNLNEQHTFHDAKFLTRFNWYARGAGGVTVPLLGAVGT
jgi:hypothetical protein